MPNQEVLSLAWILILSTPIPRWLNFQELLLTLYQRLFENPDKRYSRISLFPHIQSKQTLTDRSNNLSLPLTTCELDLATNSFDSWFHHLSEGVVGQLIGEILSLKTFMILSFIEAIMPCA